MCFFLFKQKTAYEMRISDWSSDVCSSDLKTHHRVRSRQIALADQVEERILLPLLCGKAPILVGRRIRAALHRFAAVLQKMLPQGHAILPEGGDRKSVV